MRISKGKLGAFGLILAGLAQIVNAVAGGSGVVSQETVQGAGTVAAGVGLLGVRDKQERDKPEL